MPKIKNEYSIRIACTQTGIIVIALTVYSIYLMRGVNEKKTQLGKEMTLKQRTKHYRLHLALFRVEIRKPFASRRPFHPSDFSSFFFFFDPS